MNNKFFILFMVLLSIVVASCQNLIEDPKGSLTPITYFQTQSDLDAAVAAIYQVYPHDYNYGFTASTACSYFGSDDMTTDPGLNKGEMRSFDELNGNSTIGGYSQEWGGMWNGIYQANNVIANYQKVNSTEALKNAAAGQAYFLRAWSYYNLVRTFGPIPLVLGQLDVDARPARSSVADVYTSIVNDLQTAKNMLPPSLPNQPGIAGQPGKATVNAAKALLADVYLTMAGWPLNQTSNYALAATEANDLIGKYLLVPDYLTVFTTNNSTESIFTLQFNIAGGDAMRSFGNSCVPLEEVALSGNSGWDDYYPEINFFKNAPKCKRTDQTFYTTIKLLNPDKQTYTLVPWYDSRTNARHPYYNKFRSGLNGDGVTETANTIVSMNPSTNKALDIIRYPMVLLDFAEASAMANGNPTSASYDAINLVRQRAGEPNLTPGLSAIAFRDSVVYERAYEFAGETVALRWFDIVRLQLLPKIIALRDTSENHIPAKYISDPSTRYLAPIPLNEMDLNKQWSHNPGY